MTETTASVTSVGHLEQMRQDIAEVKEYVNSVQWVSQLAGVGLVIGHAEILLDLIEECAKQVEQAVQNSARLHATNVRLEAEIARLRAAAEGTPTS